MEQQFDLARFFTFSVDMLCIASFDGYFKCINPAFEQRLGWTTEELVSQPYIAYVHPGDLGKTEAEMEKLRNATAVVSFENRYRTKNGSWIWMLWTAFPDVQMQLVYGIARDITERKEREIRQEQELIAALNTLEKLEELIPICSHCKKVRNDQGYWKRIELFLEEKVEQKLTHSICPCCAEKEFGAYLAKRTLQQV